MLKATKSAKPGKPAKAGKVRRAQLTTLVCNTPGLSYAKDIRPLFNDQEIKCMIKNGPFNLGVYADVKANATAIYNAVNTGAMPLNLPPWTDAMVNTFGCWRQQGCKP